MKKETVSSVVESVKTEITERIDSLFKKELEEIYSNIEYTFTILKKVIDTEDSPVADFNTASMLWTFQNTIISSISLFRQGYLSEPMMLLRNAVEGFSVAYALQRDPLLLVKFKSNPGKFPSSRQITTISKDFPFVGKIYGLLNKFTHTSEFHTVPNISNKLFKVGPGISNEENKYFKIEIIMIKHMIHVLSSIVEYSYTKYSIPDRFWEIDKENNRLISKEYKIEDIELVMEDLGAREGSPNTSKK